MIDPTQLALIQAEIDGTLNDRERAELSRGLLEDPALREVRDEMRCLSRALDSIPQAEPPAQLREDIFAALPTNPGASPPSDLGGSTMADGRCFGRSSTDRRDRVPNPGFWPGTDAE